MMQTRKWREWEGEEIDGKYHLQRLIGTGSYGAVFQADEVVADRLIRQVAVKLIEPADRHADAQFAELIAAANLDHPALLRCIAPGQAHIRETLLLYLVAELAQGSLAERLEGPPLAAGDVRALAGQVGSALDYLHSRARPLIHRDVKPGNILRVGENWKLGDFGLLRSVPEAGAAAEALVGTPAYAPPESYEGGISPAWDVWSFGVLLYECLTGRLPFDATTTAQYRIQISSQEPSFPADLPAPFDLILRGCLQRSPTQRWSIAQVLETLNTNAPPSVSRPLNPEFYERLNAVTPDTVAAAMNEVVVSLDRKGDYRSIGEAVRSVPAGTRILVRPGEYHETLLLDKAVEIAADGEPGSVVVEVKGAACLAVRGGAPLLRGLTLHSRGGVDARRHYAVEITGGEPRLEDCDILCTSQQGVNVQGANAKPHLSRCRIHDSKTGGIVFSEGAGGTLEDCAIFANGGPGVLLRTGADPILRDCRIYEGREAGVVIGEGGKGQFEGCDIHSHTGPNIQIGDGVAPHFRRCRIHNGQQAGILLKTGAQGLFEECDIYANVLTGVTLTHQANPTFRRCTLRDGYSNGLTVSDGGQGLLEECTVSGNAFAGIKVAKGGSPVLLRCTISGGRRAGIVVHAQGRAALTACDLHTNAQANAQVETHGYLLMRDCLLHDGGEAGVLFAGDGRMEQCDIYANAQAGVYVTIGGTPVLRHCRLHHGHYPGLLVHGGEAVMEHCELFANTMPNAAIGERGRLDMRHCRLYEGKQYGLLLWDGGTGRLDECDITGNTLGGVRLTQSANPIFQDCRILRNGGVGLQATHAAEATLHRCDLRENLLGPLHRDPQSRLYITESFV